jgi:hypothetical protein
VRLDNTEGKRMLEQIDRCRYQSELSYHLSQLCWTTLRKASCFLFREPLLAQPEQFKLGNGSVIPRIINCSGGLTNPVSS